MFNVKINIKLKLFRVILYKVTINFLGLSDRYHLYSSTVFV